MQISRSRLRRSMGSIGIYRRGVVGGHAVLFFFFLFADGVARWELRTSAVLHVSGGSLVGLGESARVENRPSLPQRCALSHPVRSSVPARESKGARSHAAGNTRQAERQNSRPGYFRRLDSGAEFSGLNPSPKEKHCGDCTKHSKIHGPRAPAWPGTFVDIHLPVSTANVVPTEHGYRALYGALSNVGPARSRS